MLVLSSSRSSDEYPPPPCPKRLSQRHCRLRGGDALTRDGRPIVPAPPKIDRNSGGIAHLRRLAREHGHQIGGMTPLALYGGQPPDYGLDIEVLIHNNNLRPARAGPSPP
jgi:hypothetical protein